MEPVGISETDRQILEAKFLQSELCRTRQEEPGGQKCRSYWAREPRHSGFNKDLKPTHWWRRSLCWVGDFTGGKKTDAWRSGTMCYSVLYLLENLKSFKSFMVARDELQLRFTFLNCIISIWLNVHGCDGCVGSWSITFILSRIRN